MPSTYTTNHNLEKPASGEQSGSWGDTINSNMDTIDAALKTVLDSVTISANNATDETVYPVFVDGSTGSQGLESDTGLTYNPSTGVLTTTQVTGNLTGNVTGNTSGSSGSCTGNAATATALASARNIGGVSFDGTGNIDLPGVNTAGNQATSGNAATATLATSVTISANNATDETVYPAFVDGSTGTQGLETDTGLTYNPSSGVITATQFTGAVTGNVTGNASGSSGSCTGNAATATALATGRTIGGVSFDGTGNIDLPGVNTAGDQDTSGTAALATSVTVSANNTTNETVYPLFVDGATGTQGAETDTGLKYNPSTGELVTTKARIGTGSSNKDLILQSDVAPSPAVGGSGKAAIMTNGDDSAGWHIGFEIPSNDVNDGFFVSTDADQDGTVDTVALKIKANGYVGILKTAPSTALDVTGTITGDTKSFSIPHPLPSKVETHKLIHGSVEAPRYDLIYRGKVTLESGTASVNIDTVSGMTEGTLVALCRDLQSFTTNEAGWTAIKSSLSGNTLTIEAQDDTCTDEISWVVMGERKDPNVITADLTDDTGRLIVEMPLPEEEETSGED
jgi:hypothetical protein